MNIETERLLVEPFSIELIDGAVAKDRNKILSLGYNFSEEWPEPDLAEALPHFKQLIAANGINGFNSWIIIDKKSKDIIGSIGFIGNPDDKGRIEIGFGIIPSKRKQNYCFEAGKSLITWAFKQPDVKEITAKCDGNNLASVKTLEKLGFIKTNISGSQILWFYRAV